MFRMKPIVALLALVVVGSPAHPQVTPERLARAAQEPHNWLTYSGGYFSQRYSELKQITPVNAKNLELKWILPNQVFGAWQSTPLVVDGVMYVTQRPNDVLAVDASTGRVFWLYRYPVSPDARVCCGSNNRGVAILGDTLFLATLDAHLVALDARTGRSLWNVAVADPRFGYSMTMAPLVVKDKVLVGVGGGEYGIRGFIAAFDAATGKEVWRFHTVPGPGEKGHETWPQDNDAWEHGGAPVWQTPAVDPELGLMYFSTGNASPDLDGSRRKGDNLFAALIVAVDAKTGEYRWHFQQVHHDIWDYDSPSPVVLFDVEIDGEDRKGLGEASKTGWVYLLDRETGEPLLPIEERPVPQLKSQATAPTQPIPSYPPLFSHEVTEQDVAGIQKLANANA